MWGQTRQELIHPKFLSQAYLLYIFKSNDNFLMCYSYIPVSIRFENMVQGIRNYAIITYKHVKKCWFRAITDQLFPIFEKNQRENFYVAT